MSAILFAPKGGAAPSPGMIEPITVRHDRARRAIALRPIGEALRLDLPARRQRARVQPSANSQPAALDPAVPRKHFTLRLDPDRHRAFRQAAERAGCSGQALLVRLLDSHLAQGPASDGSNER